MGSSARQRIAQVVPLAKETFSEFQRHKAQWLAAAISYLRSSRSLRSSSSS